MKIQCDVCDVEEASVFCSADEAALCESCDRRVHHANKLASKHLRFSLLQPSSSKESPLCDICREKRALLFCQQDRALLCKECDVPIHKANAHTQKHTRFLLTGVKLSASSIPFQQNSPSPSSSSGMSNNPFESTRISGKSAQNDSASAINHPVDFRTNSASNYFPIEMESSCCTNQEGSYAASSISEYLIETLPGWHVDDFLDPSSSPYCLYST